MKQIETYLVDSYVDFKGQEKKVVMCAVSREAKGLVIARDFDGMVSRQDLNGDENLFRQVSFGFSVCDPRDEFNLEVGKKIAMQKALNYDKLYVRTIWSNAPGLINEHTVDALLESEMERFQTNPEKYITDYKKQEERYFEDLSLVDEYDSLDPKSKYVVDAIIGKDVDVDYCTKLANNLTVRNLIEQA